MPAAPPQRRLTGEITKPQMDLVGGDQCGDEVAAVFCAPEKEGARPDALRVAAQEKGLKVHRFKSLRDPEATRAMKDAGADIGIMAFVLQFAPQEFVNIPKHGTIQYHPSLLPKYRGPSSINWPRPRGKPLRPGRTSQ